MDWRAAYLLATGREVEGEWLEPYQATLVYLAIVMSGGLLLRTLTSFLAPPSVRPYLLSFLATTEVCAYFFENNFVSHHYGGFWLGVAIVLECFIAARTFFGASENPCHAIHALVFGHMALKPALIFVVVQTLGGLASYRIARLIWSLDMIAEHHERYLEVSCESDLHVTLLVGFVLELLASLSDTWFNMQKLSNLGVLDEFIKYTNAAVMIIFGLHLTGMYFNPAMATGHVFGCHGTAAWEHMFVYWVGPVLGAIVGAFLDRWIHIDKSGAIEAEAKKHQ